MLRPVSVLGLLAVALMGLGCSGAIGDGGSSPGPGKTPGTNGPGSNPGGSNPGGSNPGGSNPGGSNPGGSGTVPTTMNPVNPQGLPSDDATVPGVAPLRKLTRVEYQNTIRDLLGVGEVPAARLAAISADQDSAGSGFTRGGSVTAAPDARALLQAAEDVATSALSRMGSLLPCSPLPTAPAAQDACADQFFPALRPARLPPAADRRRGQRPEGPVPGAAHPRRRRRLPQGDRQRDRGDAAVALLPLSLGAGAGRGDQGRQPGQVQPVRDRLASCRTCSGRRCPTTSCSRRPTRTCWATRTRSPSRPAGC